MLLIAGLGNKGELYKFTRHNLGFMVIDYLVNYLNSATFINKFNSLISELTFNKCKVLFVKPQTLMNLSGKSIYTISSYYKISVNNIIIIYDDIDLPLGKLRYKLNSGSGGHNGIKSIQSYIGNSFHRIKIGIGKPHLPQNISTYVLSNFSTTELNTIINRLLQLIANNVNLLINKNFQTFIDVITKDYTWD